MIELDGATGEGGGQILRSALSLSMITGQPFRIQNIRARRSKPGLMRQHLMAVQAGASVSGAVVMGADIGSTALSFVPGKIKAGSYEFAIGTAGSCTLVLQTLIPALLHADAPSSVRIVGGTHNPMAPPVEFLQRAYCPVLARMGAKVEIAMLRPGFYPAGGGVIELSVSPVASLRPLELMERGERIGGYAEAIFAAVPASVAARELEALGSGMGWDAGQLRMRGYEAAFGPGNAVLLTLEHEHVTEVFSSLGEKGVRAETVAANVLREARAFMASGAAAGEHLADQLMLPGALAGSGRFTACSVSQHALTNALTIERFLPVSFELGEDAAHAGRHVIAVRPRDN